RRVYAYIDVSILYGRSWHYRTLWLDYARRIKYSWWGLPVPIVDMLTQRGCPWRCKFCCGPGEQNLYTIPHKDGLRGFKFKFRSVENVIEELQELYNKWKFKSIVFSDDEFLIRPKWVKEFCQKMHSYGFVEKGIKWWAAVRADVICNFEELIEEMRDAGLYMISIGFESFSDRMLEWMDKGTTTQQNWKAVEICRNLNLKIFGNFMFGLPYSDGKWYLKEDFLTFKAIFKIKPDVCSTSYFQAIPGSRFFDWFTKKKLIKDTSFSVFRTEGIGNIKGVDYKILQRLRRMINPPPTPYKRITSAISRRLPNRLGNTFDRVFSKKLR
ncbi:MAG: B12-binding domain-containing radical SAM protein, partial [Candidatus Odinarchaeota archaeon]